MHAALTQSRASRRLRCRRPPMRAALPHSSRRCEDGLQHRLMSVRDLVSPPPQPRRAGYSLIGFEDAQKRLGPESLLGCRHWDWSPLDATCTGQHRTQFGVMIWTRHVPGTSRFPMQRGNQLRDKPLCVLSPTRWGAAVTLFGSVLVSCRRRVTSLSTIAMYTHASPASESLPAVLQPPSDTGSLHTLQRHWHLDRDACMPRRSIPIAK